MAEKSVKSTTKTKAKVTTAKAKTASKANVTKTKAKATPVKAKDLIIVESPTKAKKISNFLGAKYSVIASNGHIRDLPKSKLGIDVENGFSPEYITVRGKGTLISDIKKRAKASNKIYLATDPD
ncbi:MAG: DNA topoisomerase I, partial [Clostridiales bacterium]|nr:DNA topoisomerase I [Clostridiales bacterium]